MLFLVPCSFFFSLPLLGILQAEHGSDSVVRGVLAVGEEADGPVPASLSRLLHVLHAMITIGKADVNNVNSRLHLASVMFFFSLPYLLSRESQMNPCDRLFAERLLSRWDQVRVAASCRGMLSKSWLPISRGLDVRDHGVGGGGCGCGCTGGEEEEGGVGFRVGRAVEEHGSGVIVVAV